MSVISRTALEAEASCAASSSRRASISGVYTLGPNWLHVSMTMLSRCSSPARRSVSGAVIVIVTTESCPARRHTVRDGEPEHAPRADDGERQSDVADEAPGHGPPDHVGHVLDGKDPVNHLQPSRQATDRKVERREQQDGHTDEGRDDA